MKISEIMIKNVQTLSSETPVFEAIDTLFAHKISGLPVVDREGKLVGMFTEKGILKAILPSYVLQVGQFVYEATPKTIKSKLAKLSELKVADLMRKELVKVLEDTPIYEVAHIMLTQNVRRVPVVDCNNKIVGIVARSDVLLHFLKG